MAAYQEGQGPLAPFARAGLLVQYGAAVLSLALVVGVGIWGYRLVVRDIEGLPVVRAVDGPLRSTPTEPGGEIAPHVGLAVNAVVASGEAAPPEEMLLLAPPTPELTEDDMIVQTMAEAEEITPVATPEPVAGPMRSPEAVVAAADPGSNAQTEMRNETPTGAPTGAQTEVTAAPAAPGAPLSAQDVLALADLIAAGADPLAALAPAPGLNPDPAPAPDPGQATAADAGPAEPTDAAASDAAAPGSAATPVILAPATAAAVARAARPPARPAGLVTIAATGAATETEAPAATPASGGAIRTLTEAPPLGTTLVQLGAFESTALATEEWGRLRARFSDYVYDKDPVIEAAVSGGRDFYRLRALNFADLAEARRFCSVLVAEGADCIPVVVR